MQYVNRETTLYAVTLLALCGTTVTLAQEVILSDLIVIGSACIGSNCVAGESIGEEAIRLRQNNVRIKAVDHSSAAGFPSNDWQITFNDRQTGGANKFSIDDLDGGRTPFTIEAGAPSNSLYVDDGGRIGLGTSTPLVEAHVKDGDTPTLRLEQDGSNGFTPQTWDVAGNETGFFIRDATNGSTLPFRIIPGAPNQALIVHSDGDVGIGTDTTASSSAGSLHIRRTSGAPSLVLETTTPTPSVQWEIKANETTGRLTFKDLNGTTTPFKFQPTAAENLFRVGIVNNNTVDINGDLVVTGNCTEADGACADYVFEPDYELRSLDALAEFIVDNRHLPNVPSADEIEANGVNMAHFSGRLLEKIEELTLYTLQQQETIDALNTRLARMESAIR